MTTIEIALVNGRLMNVSEPELPIVRTRLGGYSVARMCDCGHVQRSGKDVIGEWHCVHCGRRKG